MNINGPQKAKKTKKENEFHSIEWAYVFECELKESVINWKLIYILVSIIIVDVKIEHSILENGLKQIKVDIQGQ